jgi:hypothetical protein
MGVTEALRLECLLRVPRGAGGGPELAAVEDPQTSLAGAHAPSPLWSAPRMRVAHAGDVALLAPDGSAVVRFDALGAPGAVTPLPRRAGIVDYVAPPDGTVVLLEHESGRNVLRRVGPDGDELWRRDGPAGIRTLDWDALEGSFGGLLTDGAGNAFLVAQRPRAAVARVGDEGALEPLAELGPPGAPPQMDEAGRLFTVGYDAESRLRSWNTIDPASGEREATPCDGEASDALALPIGVDRQGRAYGAAGTSVACVDGGRVAWRFSTAGVVPLDDGTVLSAAPAGPHELEIAGWSGGAAPERLRLRLPDAADGRRLDWRLIATTPDRGHVLWGAAGAGGADALAVLGPDGRLRELADPAPTDARLRGWSLAAARDWRVDAAGRVHLAAAGPDAVAVLRSTAV